MSSQSNIVHLRQNYQIKVTLKGAKPPIWRRLVLDSRITLDDLHDVLQVSMGWHDSHLHQFVDKNRGTYGPKGDDSLMDFGMDKTIDESQVLLSELLKNEKDWIKYEYDFGDGWEHKILLEKIVPHQKDQLPVVCIKGKRSCPPEDCGGIWGYKNMLDNQALDPNERDEELLEWLSEDFDAEHFSLNEVNAVLGEIFEGVVFNGKAGLNNELQRIKNDALFSEEDFLDGDMDLSKMTSELLDDPDLPEEMKDLIGGMREAAGIVMQMDEMLELAMRALEDILDATKDKKVIAIAEKALNALGGNDDDSIDY